MVLSPCLYVPWKGVGGALKVFHVFSNFYALQLQTKGAKKIQIALERLRHHLER
jgi:hypothetical protein